MASIAKILDRAQEILSSSGVSEPRRESISLLTASIRRDKTFIYAHSEYELTADELATFDSFLSRRANREPLQYIVGVQEFYGLDFEVTRDVLIPRPETELLVEEALKIFEGDREASFCEVGIGSGCIAISILHHARRIRATGLDVSPSAMRVAERNATKHRVADRLVLLESDVFGSLGDETFELIVSNPPYIPVSEMETLQVEVRDFEPRHALTDGDDGLSIIRRIVSEAPGHLSPAGHLMMEIGFDQSDELAAMFDPGTWSGPEFRSDLQGIRRVVSARLK